MSRKGSALVGSPHRVVSRRFGQTAVGDLFVDHQMRINQFYVAMKFGPLPHGVKFSSWRSFSKPISPNTQLIPDALLELQASAGIRAHFLEVDMGTETRTVWDRKIRGYVQFALSGDFSRIFAEHQFRVLVLATSEKRLTNIRSVVAKHTDKIFYLATFKSIESSGLWSSVWLRPTGDQRQSLL